MTDHTESLFQSSGTWIALLIAAIAAMVAIKTVSTTELAPGLADRASFALAERLTVEGNGAWSSQGVRTIATAPGYALVLSQLANWDPNLAAGLHCHQRGVRCDSQAFASLFFIQYGLALIGLAALFLCAWVLSRSWSVALLTLILAFVAGAHGLLAGQLSPLIWPQSLFLVFLLCAALASTRDDWRWAGAAGIAVGLATLFLPQLLVVGLVTALSLWWIGRSSYLNLKTPRSHALALLAGLGLVFAALSLHVQSATLFAAMSEDVKVQFSERLQFGALEFWSHLSLVFAPIPVIGAFFKWLFGGQSLEHVVQLAANATPHATLWSYLAATPGLLMRGLWVGTPILTTLGLLHIMPLLKFAREDVRLGPTLIVALPILSLVAINTMVTTNRPEHNVGLVFLLIYATAYLVGRTDIRRMFWADKEQEDVDGVRA